MKSEPVNEIPDIKLTKKELTQFARDYDFVKWKNDLDKRANEAKASGKYREDTNGTLFIRFEP